MCSQESIKGGGTGEESGKEKGRCLDRRGRGLYKRGQCLDTRGRAYTRGGGAKTGRGTFTYVTENTHQNACLHFVSWTDSKPAHVQGGVFLRQRNTLEAGRFPRF